MLVEWNEQKNQWLIENRRVSFEEVEEIYSAGQYIQVIDHPNQKIILFTKDEYVYCAPFIETEKGIFLKTIFPDRKRTKQYGGRNL